MVYQGEDLSNIICKFDDSEFALSQFEGLHVDTSDLIDEESQITPNSILEDPLECRGSSCSNNVRGNSGISHDGRMVKNKKKSSGFFPGLVLSLSNRRKGAPQRSPLS